MSDKTIQLNILRLQKYPEHFKTFKNNLKTVLQKIGTSNKTKAIHNAVEKDIVNLGFGTTDISGRTKSEYGSSLVSGGKINALVADAKNACDASDKQEMASLYAKFVTATQELAKAKTTISEASEININRIEKELNETLKNILDLIDFFKLVDIYYYLYIEALTKEGMKGIGKSTLVTQISTRIVNNGGDASRLIYFDAEKASEIDRIKSFGIKPERLIPPIKRGTTVEAFYGLLKVLKEARAKQREEHGEEFIMINPYVVICDSIASMPSEREIAADEDINKAMGTVARLHSGLMKLYLDSMFEFNITVIFINQLRDKLSIGGMPAPKSLAYGKMSEEIPGGKALPYYSFTLARLARVSDLEEEKYGAQAIKVQLNFLKTKNSETNRPINMVFFPSSGYDNFWPNN
jgi:RecA/RadA recombinase